MKKSTLSACSILLLFVITTCENEDFPFDENLLTSVKWKLEKERHCDEHGSYPAFHTMIFRPSGEFVLRDDVEQTVGYWEVSFGRIEIYGIRYRVLNITAERLTLENGGCRSEYGAAPFDEITRQGISSLSRVSATFHAVVETNFPEALHLEFQYGLTQAFDQTIDIPEDIITSYPPTTISKDVTDLQPGALYYYRLKASRLNPEGQEIFYGASMTFRTFNQELLQDIDGNAYHTVTINGKIWMAENLRVTHLRDGTSIPNITDGAQWATRTEPALCFLDALPSACGAFYNWHAVATQQLCPTGWHFPTASEWSQLQSGLNAQNKLKEASTLHWSPPNYMATNETGFSAMGCGFRISNNVPSATFVHTGLLAGFWKEAGPDPGFSYAILLDTYPQETVREYSYEKRTGMCVRCVMD